MLKVAKSGVKFPPVLLYSIFKLHFSLEIHIEIRGRVW